MATEKVQLDISKTRDAKNSTANRINVGFFFKDNDNRLSLLEEEYMRGSSVFLDGQTIHRGNTNALLMTLKTNKNSSVSFKQIVAPVSKSSPKTLTEAEYNENKRNVNMPNASYYEEYNKWVSIIEQYDRAFKLGYKFGDTIQDYAYQIEGNGTGLLFADYIVPYFRLKKNNQWYCLIIPKQVVRIYYTLHRIWNSIQSRYVDFRLTKWQSRFEIEQPMMLLFNHSEVRDAKLPGCNIPVGTDHGTLNWGGTFVDSPGGKDTWWGWKTDGYGGYYNVGGDQSIGEHTNWAGGFTTSRYWNLFKQLNIEVITGQPETAYFSFTPGQWKDNSVSATLQNGEVVKVQDACTVQTDTRADKEWYGPWFNWLFVRWATCAWYDRNGVYQTACCNLVWDRGYKTV
jgi:hypothetical protein